jgi:hypothetical protein
LCAKHPNDPKPKNSSFEWYRKTGRVIQPETLIRMGTANGGTSTRGPVQTRPNGSFQDHTEPHGAFRLGEAMSLQVKENGLDGKPQDQA